MEDNYPVDSEKIYFSEDYLTLEMEGVPTTLRIGEWLNTDHVRIHRMIVRDKVLQVDQLEVFNPLISKLRRADLAYYKRIMGLKVMIDFPGYSSGVEARIPYDTDPVGFYKWWRKSKHEHVVTLSPPYQFKLFQKVWQMDPKVMLKKDVEFLKSF